MRAYSVVLLESNTTLLEQLKEAFYERKEFQVVHAGDDGGEGLQKLLALKPDLVVVSIFLKGTDGNEIIRTVKKTWEKTKIVATGFQNDEIIEKAISDGAAYYLVKPFSLDVAMERFSELMRDKPAHEKDLSVVKRKSWTIDEKISEIFISIGIPPNIKGYAYLREGIKLMVETGSMLNKVTKELYPVIAKKYSTTSSRVERAIRHAIEVAWNRGRIEAINAIFGSRIYLGTERPTNSEFMALVADKLMLERLL